MSGSRWVITPPWLFESWRSFLYSSSVCSFHLFLVSSVSVRSIPSLSFIEPIFAWNVPLVSLIFLKRPQSFPSCCSLYFFALTTEEGFLVSPCFLWISAFRWVYLSFSPLLFASLLFTVICKASSDSHFSFLHFFFLGWSWSLSPVQCYEPPSIVHQPPCLSDIIPWIYLLLPLYNCKGFDSGHTWMV